MTNEKARDFFSAYYEGSLEPGLSVSLEQKFKSDSDLRHEYDSFSRAMGELGTLKFEEIEIPADLHERITARLDRHIYEQKRKPSFAWNSWFRNLGFAGLGAVAILGAVLAINQRGSTVGSNLGLSSAPSVDSITMAMGNDGVLLNFAPGSLKTVVITDGQGNVQYRRTTARETMLSNPLPNAAVFGVQFEGSTAVRYVAVPGRVRSSINKGDGTVTDLAKAVSDYYHVPVSFEASTPNQRIQWTFSSSNVVDEASKALGPGYTVTLPKDILEISDHK